MIDKDLFEVYSTFINYRQDYALLSPKKAKYSKPQIPKIPKETLRMTLKCSELAALTDQEARAWPYELHVYVVTIQAE